MAFFYYRAFDQSTREIISGRIEKENIFQVEKFLQNQQLLTIKIKKLSIFTIDIKNIGVFINEKLSSQSLALFCKQLAFIIDSGCSLSISLDIIISKIKNKTFVSILKNVQKTINEGESLSNSLERFDKIPRLVVNMIKVGEESGNLKEVLVKLYEFYDIKSTNKKSFQNAMIYPIIVSVSMLFVLLFTVIYLVPNFVDVFVSYDMKLPLPTKILFAISTFLRKNLFYILFLAIVIFIFVFIYFKSKKGIFLKDKLLLKIPIVSNIYKVYLNMQISEILSILVFSGVSIVNSIDILKKVVNNVFLNSYFDKVKLGLESGQTLSKSITNIYFIDNVMVSMIQVGEQSGFLSSALKNCSEYFRQELSFTINNMSKLIEPIITIVLGLILLFIVLAIMLPNLYMTDFIK